jgi:transposase InsO family protein
LVLIAHHKVPLHTITALVIAKAFCDAWMFSYGPPRHPLTDNGTQFNAKFFIAVCRELRIAKIFTTAYHPQTNGQVERFNRTIINSLLGYVERRQGAWDEYTAAITFGYNCRVQLPGTFVPPLGAIRANPVQTPAKPVSGERPDGD